MNEFKTFLQFGILFCFFFSYCQALECYVCDSRENSRCGVTWSVEKPENYVKTCNSTFETTCRKFVIDMMNEGGQIVVRECFGPKNMTSKFKPNKCRDEEYGLEACYCTSDLCNGQTSIVPDRIIPFMVFVVSCMAGLFIA